MFVLFALTGVWFWLSVLAGFSWLCWAVRRDYYGYATLDLVLVLALWSVTGNLAVLDIWHSMQTNPTVALTWVGGYLGLGVVWATVKWKLVLRKLKAKFDEWKKNYDEQAQRAAARREADRRGLIPQPQEPNPEEAAERRRRDFLSSAVSSSGLTLVDGKPKVDVAHYRTRIMGWMAYWPVSAILWVLGDLLADVFDQIYRMIRGVFQRMADSEFE